MGIQSKMRGGAESGRGDNPHHNKKDMILKEHEEISAIPGPYSGGYDKWENHDIARCTHPSCNQARTEQTRLMNINDWETKGQSSNPAIYGR